VKFVSYFCQQTEAYLSELPVPAKLGNFVDGLEKWHFLPKCKFDLHLGDEASVSRHYTYVIFHGSSTKTYS